MAKSTKSNTRSFAVDTSSLAAERPLLETGYYAGQLENAGVTMGSGDNTYQLLNIEQKVKFAKGSRKPTPVPGEFIVRGQFTFGATLFSKKAIKVLQRDEPKVFGGRFYVNFDEDFKLDVNNNILFRSLLTTLHLENEDFHSMVDFEWDEDIATPENVKAAFTFRGETDADKQAELDAVMAWEGLVLALNSVVYHRKFFAHVAESVNGQRVLVKVEKRDNYKTPEVKENAIGTGTSAAPFIGFQEYREGAEFDLEEEG